MKIKNIALMALILSANGLQAQVFGFEETNFGVLNVLNGKEGSTSFNFGSSGNSITLPVKWDTSWGGYWASGWALSQKYDSTRETSNFKNHLYSSIAYKGAAGSNTFAVGTAGSYLNFNSLDSGIKVRSIMISNSTFVYNSMKFGDMLSKKFGGPTGTDADSFILIVSGFNKKSNKLIQTVRVPLADYRFTNSAQDYIIESWQQVNISGDSLLFSMESSDNGMFGVNTPLYFCIDNITAGYNATINSKLLAVESVFPNPFSNALSLQSTDFIETATVYSLQGKLCAQYNIQAKNAQINTTNLPNGVYFIQLQNNQGSYIAKVIKE